MLVPAFTVEPPNKGHFGNGIYSAYLFFVERLSSLRGSKCIVGIILGSQVASFVERCIILGPYLGSPLSDDPQYNYYNTHSDVVLLYHYIMTAHGTCSLTLSETKPDKKSYKCTCI